MEIERASISDRHATVLKETDRQVANPARAKTLPKRRGKAEREDEIAMGRNRNSNTSCISMRGRRLLIMFSRFQYTVCLLYTSDAADE